MGFLSGRRPSAAMAVAIVALVVAASGTALAGTRLVSGNSLIKKNSLSGNRLQNRSVTGAKIKLSSLGTVPKAGAAPISNVTYETATIAVPTSTAGPGTPGTATCPAGEDVIGGGASIVDTTNGMVEDSYPSGTSGWSATFFEGTTATTGTVTAICAPASSTTP
jgi:hypothetical protein